MTRPNPASQATLQANASLASQLPADDGQDFRDARRGFIATTGDAHVLNAAGRTVWSMAPFSDQTADAPPPDSVNPSLWRQARLNAIHGLFKVAEGLYQVRGFDLSNITFVEGETGVIIIDPLTSAEPAAAALALYRSQRGERPVRAVIYTHSHVDHYGGVLGVLSDADIRAGMRIIAPEGFLKEATSENILAGNAMGRRATYMYGALLPPGPLGHVDAGLGKTTSRGAVSLIPPNDSITRTGETRRIDGVDILFQMTPDSEAPAEMNFYFPHVRALCVAENCTCHLHNILTPRGALVRDAKSWSGYIEEARGLFAGRSDVVFASHHWPRWDTDRIDAYLSGQRDLYKFVHDQTLRLANHGLNPEEIAEQLRLPPSLEKEWYTRSYYGTLSHNAKAVYQRYLGWFDGNPAKLHPHPPSEAGRRYVRLAGGADALLAQARTAYEDGDYRWVAELVNHLVFAEPGNLQARALQADALEQMGYQAESGPWRSFFLTGAQELRQTSLRSERRAGPAGQIRPLPASMLLDSCSVRINAGSAADVRLSFVLHVTDTGERFQVDLENAVLRHAAAPEDAPAEVSLPREDLAGLILGDIRMTDARTGGDPSQLARLIGLLDVFEFWFGIVTP